MKAFLKAGFFVFMMAAMAAPALATAPAPAAKASSPAAANLKHPELKKFVDDGGNVDFLGNLYGLDGWLLSKADAEPRTVYTSPEGGMVMGILLNPDGTVQTNSQLAALKARLDGSQAAMPGAEKANGTKTERLYAEIEKARWIKVGRDDAPYIYMIINIACPHCQEYWKDLQPAVKAGKLQLRVMPFGAAKENREGGAALLSVSDPAAAWQKFIDGDASALSKDKAVIDMYGAVDENTKLLNKWKFRGAAPFTVYRKISNGEIVAIVGRPQNTMLLQADLIR